MTFLISEEIYRHSQEFHCGIEVIVYVGCYCTLDM